jgi:hypothetical protein
LLNRPQEDEKSKTPKKSESSGKRASDFWCDLCQSVVASAPRVSHMAAVHFESRLKRTLPTAGAFACPLCR